VTSNNEELGHVLISVDDPMYGGASTERVWAKALGDDLYEIRNTPWHTCAVAWGDVVRAKSESEDQWPTMMEVVTPGGHRTLHIYFLKPNTPKTRESVLKSLAKYKASYENAEDSLYAIDVDRKSDYEGLLRYLAEMETEGVLDYRTVVSSSGDA
jgi:hypothetical protein